MPIFHREQRFSYSREKLSEFPNFHRIIPDHFFGLLLMAFFCCGVRGQHTGGFCRGQACGTGGIGGFLVAGIGVLTLDDSKAQKVGAQINGYLCGALGLY